MAVDGGQAYLRRVGDLTRYREMSITIPDEADKAIRAAVKWGQDTKRNTAGIAWAVLRALRDSGIDMKAREEPSSDVALREFRNATDALVAKLARDGHQSEELKRVKTALGFF